jgi:hypothetical protein
MSSYLGPSFGHTGQVRKQRQQHEETLVKEALLGGLSNERREQIRSQAQREIPAWYNPWVHLSTTTGIGVLALCLGTWQLAKLGQIEPSDLLIIPITFVLANLFEWRVHKHVLHRRRWPMEMLYDKHTPMHHMIYVEDDMTLRSQREFRLVLIPAVGVLGVVLVTTPFALGIAALWSTQAGWLFLVTASLYMVTYELLHLAYHAPKDSFIGRRRFISAMRRHHARHHNPRLMQRYNFNVIIPLSDYLLGTIAPASQRRDNPHKEEPS